MQLFGDTPEVMAHAARWCWRAAAVRGRPARPVARHARHQHGLPGPQGDADGRRLGACWPTPTRAVAVAAAVVRVAAEHGVPVTVKLRSGVQEGERTAVALAPRLEEVGVAALGVHPRATSQYYHGKADHTVTAAVVRAVGIPVIASGDVTSVSAAQAIVEATGAAAVMVARGARGDPWLVDALLAGEDRPRPPLPRGRRRPACPPGPGRSPRWGRSGPLEVDVQAHRLVPAAVARAGAGPRRAAGGAGRPVVGRRWPRWQALVGAGRGGRS